ncbi:unnamed protein product [Didymodactylos carnosus]|uniref:Uncharacterized protein n=1 Tax=Didymodactylos carnosus TaxID=1234261 RepID=A0A814VQG7_9BILA|nr:unnamed protein product [Didymodactylos carnosus]CAF1194216.1 unnamed protein product [Didymodactylos carnosus]CAF3958634.1 unnamed protein product [Didymodactylos carnosus]CAF3991937.1 unnamed protein product [Didymodactylos carnosus]
MTRRLITSSLFSINKNFSIPTLIINRAVSSTIGLNDLKILGFGAGNKPVPEARKSLAEKGYNNIKIFGIYNTKESDQELIAALKEKQWDVVAIGSYVNGFDQAAHYQEKGVSTDRTEILLWFNRVLNLVHELAPKSKIVLLKSPHDLFDGIQRILGVEQKQT